MRRTNKGKNPFRVGKDKDRPVVFQDRVVLIPTLTLYYTPSFSNAPY